MSEANNIHDSIKYVVSRCQALGMTRHETEDLLTKEWLAQTLKAAGNNQCVASELIGVHRNTLSREIKRLGILVSGKRKQRAA